MALQETDCDVQAAAQRMVEFWLGTFADPIYLGDWPASVKARIPYIPTITPELVSLCACSIKAGKRRPVSRGMLSGENGCMSLGTYTPQSETT